MNLSRRRIDEIVDAVGKALGVDTGTMNESTFDACCKTVREVLREGRNDAELGREILELMCDTYRAELMHWEGVRAAAGNAESAAAKFLEGDAAKAKEVYDLAKAQYDSAHGHRRARFNVLYEALIEPRKKAGEEKNTEASLLFQELLDQNAVR